MGKVDIVFFYLVILNHLRLRYGGGVGCLFSPLYYGEKKYSLIRPYTRAYYLINIYIIIIRITIPHPPHRAELGAIRVCEFEVWGIGGTVIHPHQKSLVYGGEVGVSTGAYSTS